MDCLGLLQGEPHEEDGGCGQLGHLRMAVDANEDHWMLFASFSLLLAVGSTGPFAKLVRLQKDIWRLACYCTSISRCPEMEKRVLYYPGCAQS